MAIAKGQYNNAESFLNNLPQTIRLIIPSICYLEALISLQNEIKRRNHFRKSIDIEISEANRNQNSESSQLLASNLDNLRLTSTDLLDEFQERFIYTISLLSQRVETLSIEPSNLQKTLTKPILSKSKELRDDLILQCIIEHAQHHPQISKIFISANTQQFNKSEFQYAFQETGIRFFSTPENFLGWLNTQTNL